MRDVKSTHALGKIYGPVEGHMFRHRETLQRRINVILE